MGIYVDYVLRAECAEETLRERLETVRRRCLDLPLKVVGEVRRIAPVYNPVVVRLFRSQGYALPDAIAQRLRPVEGDPDHGELCLTFAPMLGPELPKRQRDRYFSPVLELLERTDLWRAEELPEEIKQTTPWGFTTFMVTRRGIEFEFASILLRYGYLLILHPGEGSVTVALALSTFHLPTESCRSRKPPLWYGQGFKKTQYAKSFIQVHETVCRVLDIAQEEGLLFKASDNCGYFASRSWKVASKRVNEELLFARTVSGLVGVAIGNLREEGGPDPDAEVLDFCGPFEVFSREITNLIAWIAARGREVETLTSVCTGAMLLGRAGLLDGRCATTHWHWLSVMREQRSATWSIGIPMTIVVEFSPQVRAPAMRRRRSSDRPVPRSS